MKDRAKCWHTHLRWTSSSDALISNHHRYSLANNTQHIADYSVTESNLTYFCSLLYIVIMPVAISSDNFVDCIYYIMNLNGFTQIKILMHYPFNDLQCQIYSLCSINSSPIISVTYFTLKMNCEVPQYF